MNGFERMQRDEGTSSTLSASSDAAEHRYPDDFSPEEARFADDLRDLFAPDHDELPPLFTQTLLGDVASDTAPTGFEQRLAYRVMRQLRLPRRPLAARTRLMRRLIGEMSHHPRSGMQTSLKTLRDETLTVTTGRVARPIAGVMGTLAILVVASVLLTAPSFAMGMQIILGQTGVREVNGYPTHNITTTGAAAKHTAADDAPVLPGFSPLWAGMAAAGYSYQGMRLLTPPAKKWSRGPIVDLQYTSDRDGAVLDIREFQVAEPYAAVLQVVQDGSATQAQVDANTAAVYVDGAWMQRPMQTNMTASASASRDVYIWTFGVRGELIFQRDGVVYWIVGSQHDGMDQNGLLDLVRQLTPMNSRLLDPGAVQLRQIGYSLVIPLEQYQPEMELYQLVPKGTALNSGAGAFVAVPYGAVGS
ncbi:MAG: hypothetical protein ABI068_07700 [Ktedonobacterales bacterium]